MNRWWNQPNVSRFVERSHRGGPAPLRARDEIRRPTGQTMLDLTTQIRAWSARHPASHPDGYARDLCERARALEPAIATLDPRNADDSALCARSARSLQLLLDHAQALGLELGEVIMLYDDAWASARRSVQALMGEVPHPPEWSAPASPAQEVKITSACAPATQRRADTRSTPVSPSCESDHEPHRSTPGRPQPEDVSGSEP